MFDTVTATTREVETSVSELYEQYTLSISTLAWNIIDKTSTMSVN